MWRGGVPFRYNVRDTSCICSRNGEKAHTIIRSLSQAIICVIQYEQSFFEDSRGMLLGDRKVTENIDAEYVMKQHLSKHT